MVKICRAILLGLLVLFCGACYKLIPHRYLNRYTKIASSPKEPRAKWDFIGTYAIEDEFFSDYYSKKYNKEVHSYYYIFFFRNNLMASILIPFQKKNGEFILTIEEYLKYVKEKSIDDTRDYHWTYFSLKDSVLTEYYLDYEVGNWNVTNMGKIKKFKYLILPNGIISKYSYKKYKSDTLKFKKNIYAKIPLDFKPDSLKSDIYCRLMYKPKGYRRIYAGNSPVQLNPCTSLRPTRVKLENKTK